MEGVLYVPLTDVIDYIAVLANQTYTDSFEASEMLQWVVKELGRGLQQSGSE